MNKKRIIFISLLLFLILGVINSVSAENIDTSSNQTSEINDINLENNENVVKKTTNEETFTDFMEIVDSASAGSTIYLNGAYYSAEDRFDSISIKKNLIINGASATDDTLRTTFDGKNVSRLFNLGNSYSSGLSVTFININFINGYQAKSGAAINAVEKSTINIYNCIFSNNKAVETGSALNTGIFCSITIHNSTFENSLSGIGGALFLQNINYLDMQNCTFYNNTALTSGGSIWMSSKSSEQEISNCLFINNTAKGNESTSYGGALVINNLPGETNTATLKNLTFINNTGHKGGAAHIQRGILEDLTFINNTGYEGGALVAFTTTITNITFINNTAQSYGGLYGLELTIENGIFINNVANNSGGGLSSKSATITNSIFINNTAKKGGGGAIYGQYGSLTIRNTTFINNSALNSDIYDDGGGAVITHNIYVYDCLFDNNIINKEHGGTITCTHGEIVNTKISNTIRAIKSQYDVTLTNTTITNVTGTAVKSMSGLVTLKNTLVTNVTGAAIISYRAEVYDSIITNTSGGNAAIEVTNLTVTNTTFIDNSGLYAGAIYHSTFSSRKSILNIKNSRFINNSGKKASQIYRDNTEITIENCYFEDNDTSAENAIYIKKTNATLNLRCNFKNNTISSPLIEIYTENQIISSTTHVIYENITGVINVHQQLSAILTDDNYNRIIMKSIPSLIEGIPITFDYNKNTKNYTAMFTPTNYGTYLLTSNSPNLLNDAPINGKLIILDIATIPDSDINITFKELKHNNFTGKIVLPSYINGNVNIAIDGEVYTTITLNKGVGTWELTNLTAGTRNIGIIFLGYGQYKSFEKNFTKEILKITPIIEVNETNNKYYNAEITVITPQDATGYINLTIGNTTFKKNIVFNETIFALSNLDIGTYEVNITYSGDNSHYPLTIIKNITVEKIPLTADDIEMTLINNVFEMADFEIISKYRLPGEFIININGENITRAISSTTTYISLENCPAGQQNITLYYIGGEYSDSVTIFKNFTILKKTLTEGDLFIQILNNTYGNVTLEIDISYHKIIGNYTIKYDGKEITVPIDNDLEILIKDIPAGKSNITIIYPGNNNYNPLELTIPVDIAKKRLTENDVEIILVNRTLENIIINITSSETITGEIGFIFNNTEYMEPIVNQKATINLNKHITSEKISLEFHYNGDNNYEPLTFNKILPVPKNILNPEDITINILNNTFENATIEIVTPAAVTGEFLILISGKTIKVPITPNKTIVKLSKITAGTQNITIHYSGDENYGPTSVNLIATFKKELKPENIEITTNENNSEYSIVQVKVPNDLNGEVNLTINNNNYCKSITGDIVTFNIPKLPLGKHNITLSFGGNSYYAPKNISGVIYNRKEIDPSDITVNILNNTKGHAKIEINTPINVTGNFTINGQTLQITPNKTTITLDDLNVGTHTLNITYSGNDFYNPITTITTITIEKEKEPLNMNITLTNNTYGNVKIEINTPDDVEGTFTITTPIKTTTIPATPNKTIVTLDNLNIGNHIISITYSGDVNYLKTTLNKTITVKKELNPNNINITILNNTYNNTKIEINTPEGVTGNITVKINNQETVIKINGTKTPIILDNLPAGEHNITISYSGDETYNPITTKTTIKINKKDVDSEKIVLKTTNATYKNAVIEVNTPTDLNGNITITHKGKNYTENIKNGKATIDLSEFMEVGTHDIIISYSGDSYNNPCYTTTTINISPKTINSIKITTKVEENSATITATLSENVDGSKVEFEINNEKYNVSANNNVATLTLKNLALGNYNVKATLINPNYNPISTTDKFEIKETLIPVTIISDPIVMYAGNGPRLSVKVIDNKGNVLTGVKVNVTINGVLYERTIGATGATTFALNGLPAQVGADKVYEIPIVFGGTATYKPATLKTTVTIVSTIKTQNLVKVFQNDTQFTASLLNSEGKISSGIRAELNINGIFYYRTSKADGSIIFPINLPAGNYTLTVKNLVTNEVLGVSVTVLPNILAKNLIKYFQNDTHFTMTLLDNHGNIAPGAKLELNINGIFYERTANAKGIATFTIMLPEGFYKLTLFYNKVQVGYNVTVLPLIEAKSISMKDSKRVPFTAKVLTKAGKIAVGVKIKMNINGVYYYRTTTETGEFNLPINLPKGEYILTLMYESTGYITSRDVKIQDG